MLDTPLLIRSVLYCTLAAYCHRLCATQIYTLQPASF